MEKIKKIPQRSEIAQEDKWAVEDLYASDEAWEAELATLEADGDKVKYTLFLQTGAVALEGMADSEEAALAVIEKIGNNANAAPMKIV